MRNSLVLAILFASALVGGISAANAGSSVFSGVVTKIDENRMVLRSEEADVEFSFDLEPEDSFARDVNVGDRVSVWYTVRPLRIQKRSISPPIPQIEMKQMIDDRAFYRA